MDMMHMIEWHTTQPYDKDKLGHLLIDTGIAHITLEYVNRALLTRL